MKLFLLALALVCSGSVAHAQANRFEGRWMMVAHECKAKGHTNHRRELILFSVDQQGLISGSVQDFGGDIVALIAGLVDERGRATLQTVPPSASTITMKFSPKGKAVGRYISSTDSGPCKGTMQAWIENP